LVLLHANPGDSEDFDAILPALTPHFRVLALDWPGYGLSPLPAQPEAVDVDFIFRVLQHWLTQLNLSPAFFIGNSLGGYAAARLAVETPERVRGLILVSPGGFTPHTLVTRVFCAVQGSRFALAPPRWSGLYLKRRSHIAQAMLQRAAGPQSQKGVRSLNRALWRCFSTPSHDLRELAAHIQVPTLLVFGRADPAIPANSDGMEAVRCMPHADLVILPCGHAAFAELPERFLAHALPFLERNERGMAVVPLARTVTA
jgi:pimeloyl-ACP methyl ester carboxylesterase